MSEVMRSSVESSGTGVARAEVGASRFVLLLVVLVCVVIGSAVTRNDDRDVSRREGRGIDRTRAVGHVHDARLVAGRRRRRQINRTTTTQKYTTKRPL